MKTEIFEKDIPLQMYKHYTQFEFVSVDTETTGLDPNESKLTLMQLCDPNKEIVSIIKLPNDDSENLKQLLIDTNIIKIFHNARFDISFIYKYMNIKTSPIICTKIISKIVNKNIESHSLKNLAKLFLELDLNKDLNLRTSGFHEELSKEQIEYAANDVLYLCDLKDKLLQNATVNQMDLAEKCFEIIPELAVADVKGLKDYGAKIFDY